MMQNLIRANIQHLQGRIKDLQARIETNQALCTHELVEGKYGANTGNWCPDDDCYWIDAVCLDCDKRFHAESKRDGDLYRKLSMSGLIAGQYDSDATKLARAMKIRDIMEARE